MMKTTTVLAAVAIGAAAIGISFAPPAAAGSSNCHTVGPSIVCGQGGVSGGGQPPGALTAPVRPPQRWLHHSVRHLPELWVHCRVGHGVANHR